MNRSKRCETCGTDAITSDISGTTQSTLKYHPPFALTDEPMRVRLETDSELPIVVDPTIKTTLKEPIEVLSKANSEKTDHTQTNLPSYNKNLEAGRLNSDLSS